MRFKAKALKDILYSPCILDLGSLLYRMGIERLKTFDARISGFIPENLGSVLASLLPLLGKPKAHSIKAQGDLVHAELAYSRFSAHIELRPEGSEPSEGVLIEGKLLIDCVIVPGGDAITGEEFVDSVKEQGGVTRMELSREIRRAIDARSFAPGSSTIEFSSGRLDIGDSLRIIPSEGESWDYALPEGDGAYYLALDERECAEEGRDSRIFPSRMREFCRHWVESLTI